MSDDHELVPVASALPGMVLSDELLDSHGLVLLAKGTVLSEAIIASFARHQIDVVPVARVVPMVRALSVASTGLATCCAATLRITVSNGRWRHDPR